VPLFIVAEGAVHGGVMKMASQFVSSGIVPPAQQAVFEQIAA
jgi:hypothetical protein